MKGDFSRDGFRPENHHTGVRMQQGRVLLDADWNEQVDIDAGRTRGLAADIIGPCGVPAHGGGSAILPIEVGHHLRALAMTSDRRGWAVGEAATILVRDPPDKDGPRELVWRKQSAPSGLRATLHAVDFADAQKGVIVGDDATLLVTRNGGELWEQVPPPRGVTASLRAVRLVTGKLGYAVGDAATLLRFRQDKWEQLTTPGGVRETLRGVEVYDRSAWVVGDAATLLVTRDQGDTWERVAPPPGVSADLHAVCVVNGTQGWAVGDHGTILTTADGGRKWTVQRPPAGVRGRLLDCYFVNGDRGWITVEDGTVLATRDGGARWDVAVRLDPALGVPARAIRFQSGTEGWVVGNRGAVHRLSDGGRSFELETVPAALGEAVGFEQDLTISPGRIYVDGVVCEIGDDVTYTTQPYLPSPPALEPAAGKRHLLCLEAWERHLTAIEQPRLREEALGGPDTCTRTQTVWQIHALPLQKSEDLAAALAALQATPPLGRMSTRPPDSKAPGGYSGEENRLYRVQIASPGELGTVTASDGPWTNKTPTFLWSHDNAARALAVEQFDLDATTKQIVRVNVVRQSQEIAGTLRPDDWVELRDDSHDLLGTTGRLQKVAGVGDDGWVTFKDPLPADIDLARHPRLVIWSAEALPLTPDVTLDHGITLQFSAGVYREGDYWQFAVRALSGTVEPLTDALPAGEHRRRCPLALVTWTDIGHGHGLRPDVVDLRPILPALTELTDLVYVGGDGQEARPRQPLPHPLAVRVMNGRWPVAGALVRFTLDDSSTGAISDDPNSRHQRDVLTDEHGIATCRWTLGEDKEGEVQRVVARHLDPLAQQVGGVVHFGARISKASEVHFDTDGRTWFKSADTVQAALEALYDNRALSIIGGAGQAGLPGKHLDTPLRLRVANDGWPVAGAEVRLAIVIPQELLDGGPDEENPVEIDFGALEWYPPAGESVTGTELTVVTDERGEAEIHWRLGTHPACMSVAASCASTRGAPDTRVWFHADLLTADRVAYSSHAALYKDVTTVAGALDRIPPEFAKLRTELVDLQVVGGDGQHARPGEQLPHPLQVRVSAGHRPIADAWVRFTLRRDEATERAIDESRLAFLDKPEPADPKLIVNPKLTAMLGRLKPRPAIDAEPLPAGPLVGDEFSGDQIVVRTDSDGVARCTWTLGGPGDSLMVEAWLLGRRGAPLIFPRWPEFLKDIVTFAGPVRFGAQLSVARDVAYDPGERERLAEAKTVQAAIDLLDQRLDHVGLPALVERLARELEVGVRNLAVVPVEGPGAVLPILAGLGLDVVRIGYDALLALLGLYEGDAWRGLPLARTIDPADYGALQERFEPRNDRLETLLVGAVGLLLDELQRLVPHGDGRLIDIVEWFADSFGQERHGDGRRAQDYLVRHFLAPLLALTGEGDLDPAAMTRLKTVALGLVSRVWRRLVEGITGDGVPALHVDEGTRARARAAELNRALGRAVDGRGLVRRLDAPGTLTGLAVQPAADPTQCAVWATTQQSPHEFEHPEEVDGEGPPRPRSFVQRTPYAGLGRDGAPDLLIRLPLGTELESPSAHVAGNFLVMPIVRHDPDMQTELGLDAPFWRVWGVRLDVLDKRVSRDGDTLKSLPVELFDFEVAIDGQPLDKGQFFLRNFALRRPALVQSPIAADPPIAADLTEQGNLLIARTLDTNQQLILPLPRPLATDGPSVHSLASPGAQGLRDLVLLVTDRGRRLTLGRAVKPEPPKPVAWWQAGRVDWIADVELHPDVQMAGVAGERHLIFNDVRTTSRLFFPVAALVPGLPDAPYGLLRARLPDGKPLFGTLHAGPVPAAPLELAFTRGAAAESAVSPDGRWTVTESGHVRNEIFATTDAPQRAARLPNRSSGALACVRVGDRMLVARGNWHELEYYLPKWTLP